jgi:hypothetical protein
LQRKLVWRWRVWSHSVFCGLSRFLF